MQVEKQGASKTRGRLPDLSVWNFNERVMTSSAYPEIDSSPK